MGADVHKGPGALMRAITTRLEWESSLEGEISLAEATEVLTLVSLQGHGRYRWNSMLLIFFFCSANEFTNIAHR